MRLPVDLARDVVSGTGTGDAADVVVHDDLFTVLDAFVLWTAIRFVRKEPRFVG